MKALIPVLLWVLIPASAVRAGSDRQSEPIDLDRLLQLALASDGRILAAHARLDQYRAQYDEARWAWFPTTRLEALVGGPVGARQLACPDDPNCLRLKGDPDWQLGAYDEAVSVAVGGKLEAVMPLYTFGKIDEARRAASAGVEAGEAGIRKARQEVALQVRLAWYGFQLSVAALQVLTDGDNKLKQVEKKLVKMLDELNEEVTDRDLFKLRYYATQVGTMLVEARREKERALAALRFLTGLNDLGQRQPLAEEGLEPPADAIQTRAHYLTLADRQRPDLIMLRAALEATRAAAEIKQAELYPDFFLVGFVRGSYSPVQDYIDNPLLNNGLTNYDAGFSLGMRVTLDIPQKLARLEQALAEARRIEIQYEQAKQAIGLELDTRLNELRSTNERARMLKTGHRAAKAWMRANLMSYGVGLTNTKDMLDSLAAYAKSRIDMDRAIFEMIQARDQLQAAVGQDLGQNGTPLNAHPGSSVQREEDNTSREPPK